VEIERIKKKIQRHNDELIELKKDLVQKEKEKYQYLVGKIYKSAATAMFKITAIEDVDDDCIEVEGVRIYGGKHSNGGLEIYIQDTKTIRKSTLEKYSCEGQFVTEEMFRKFIDSSIEIMKQKLNET